jgi:hypothetical protein
MQLDEPAFRMIPTTHPPEAPILLRIHDIIGVQSALTSGQGFLNLQKENAFAWVSKSIHKMHESISRLQSVQPNAGPGSKIVSQELVVTDFEPAGIRS